MAATGIMWSIMPFLITTYGTSIQFTFIIFVVSGLTAGALSSGSAFRLGYVAFVLPQLTSLFIVFMMKGGTIYYVFSALIPVFLAMLLRSNKEYHKTLVDSLELRYSNDDLLEQMEDVNAELKTEITKQKESEALFRSLAESSASVIMVYTEKQILYINPAGEKIIGEDAETIKQKPFGTYIHPDDYEMVIERANKRLNGEQVPNHYQARLVDVEDRTHWMELSVALISYQGEKAGIVTAIDITHLKETLEQLVSSKELAEQANLAKSQFLSNMSHEIRTPMNGVLGLTNLALQTNLDDQQKEYIEKAHNSAEHLLGIINDILDFSKIEAGKLELEMIDFSISQVTENLSNLIQIKAEESGVLFTINTDKDLPPYYQGDPLRLSQILINLTTNAIKFTQTGGKVTVNIKLKEESESNLTLQCSVHDTGVGMTPQEQEKLFKPFSQTDSSITRKYGGTGLGLIISQKLTKLMNGDIWVESKKDEGSTFFFTAQLTKVKEGDSPLQENILSEQVSLAKNALEGCKILLVEDNKINQLVAKKLLTINKMQVEIAFNGQEAINLLEQQEFDGVLMDCMMPILDGYKATEHLRKNEKFQSLPIIAMTANAMKQDIEKALSAGMNDHISKPINPETVLLTMAKWIKA